MRWRLAYTGSMGMIFRLCVALLVAMLIVSAGCKRVPTTRIAFGSCCREQKSAPIFASIAKTKPSMFVFLGDNIYGDSTNMSVLRNKYATLGKKRSYQSLERICPILATWDDHDMGANDAGREYPKKDESKKLMLDFFKEPADSPRWNHAGVYDAQIVSLDGVRVQFILLDTRWFRSPLKRSGLIVKSYVPDKDPHTTILGAAQWKWLEEQLQQPADLRIIASSIQVISNKHRFEKWGNFPHERERLLDLIDRAGASKTIIISGDRHHASIHAIKLKSGTLYDVTASALNQSGNPSGDDHRNPYIVAKPYDNPNFGVIQIRGKGDERSLRLEILSENANTKRKLDVSRKLAVGRSSS